MQSAPGAPTKGTDYQAMHDEWSSMPPPDPMTLLKLIMRPGFLTQHQMDAIKALLSNPGAPGGGPSGAPAPAMPGPAAPSAPPAPLGQPPR